MTKSFIPLLEKSDNPSVVNVSSGAGSFGDPDFGLIAKGDITAYGISKLALNGLTVKLAAELKGRGIKINAVCPGFTATYPGTEEWGARPVAEGAGGIVWAATLAKNGPTGGFFRDGKILPW
jgi:NAD(P)-dependent dehydrogenase (short-subunit alcohol dehydrogenase family)